MKKKEFPRLWRKSIHYEINVFIMLKLKLSAFILFIFLMSGVVYSQSSAIEIGVGAGIGSIKGNSPSVTSLSGNIVLGYNPEFLNAVTFRTSFLIARKVEYFLPEDRRGRYYPFVKAFSLSGFIYQPLTAKFRLEEGLGFVIVNDRTFSDTDDWDFGLTASILIRYKIIHSGKNNFSIALGTEFGNTFTNSAASYFVFFLQGLYRFTL